MTEPKTSSTVSRRSFLKGFGAVAGSLALSSQLWPGLGGGHNQRPIKIGVLVPPSRIYPRLGEDLTSGMRLYFDQTGGESGGPGFELVTEDIGFGPSLASKKIAKLIQKDRVDLVAGVVSPETARSLTDIFEQHRTPFIVNELGANLVDTHATSRYVFYNSFNLWQANRAMGGWAARNLGNKAFVASSFYDSGYDALYEFQRGFEASGGKVVGTHISHVPPDEGDATPLFDAVEQAEPDFVYGFYCGQGAVNFVNSYAHSALAGKVPLAGSGFMVDDDLLPSQRMSAVGIKSALPWSRNLQNSANRTFTGAYTDRTGYQPGAFAVLGYDTARMVVEAVKATGGEAHDRGRLARALEGVRFDSPRGLLEMDPLTHSVRTPIYLREVHHGRGRVENDVLHRLDPVDLPEDLHAGDQGLTRTGWLNPYLCAEDA